MQPRKPLPHSEQIVRLKGLLRQLETDLKRRYEGYFEATRGRRDCPLESNLRRRRAEQGRDIVSLAKACLEDLRRQEAMFYAPFKPGDRVTVERVEKGGVQSRGPFLITDVRPHKRLRYRYVMVQLTKDGRMHKRQADHWVDPQDGTTVAAWKGALSEEGAWEAKYFRSCAETSRAMSFEQGDLSLFEAHLGGPLNITSYRRRDRMSPEGVGN